MQHPEIVKRSIPEVSGETLALADFLRTIPAGDVALYQDLSAVAKVNVQKEGRGRLNSARKIVLREDTMVFAPVRGLGMKRLRDEDIAESSGSAVKSINRKAHRELKKSRCLTNVQALPVHTQVKLYTHLSVLAAFETISGGKSVRQLANVIEHTPSELAPNAVLGIMLGQQHTKPKPRPPLGNA